MHPSNPRRLTAALSALILGSAIYAQQAPPKMPTEQYRKSKGCPWWPVAAANCCSLYVGRRLQSEPAGGAIRFGIGNRRLDGTDFRADPCLAPAVEFGRSASFDKSIISAMTGLIGNTFKLLF